MAYYNRLFLFGANCGYQPPKWFFAVENSFFDHTSQNLNEPQNGSIIDIASLSTWIASLTSQSYVARDLSHGNKSQSRELIRIFQEKTGTNMRPSWPASSSLRKRYWRSTISLASNWSTCEHRNQSRAYSPLFRTEPSAWMACCRSGGKKSWSSCSFSWLRKQGPN